MRTSQSSSQELFALGQHLVVERSCFSHHGIYVGYGLVIENLLEEGIVAVPINTFADGAPIKIRNHPFPKFTAREAVQRAYSRIGEKSYDLLTNNCEHFVNWCIEGLYTSRQVDNCITMCKPLVDLVENIPIVGDKVRKAKEQGIQAHLATNPQDHETSAHFNHDTQLRQTMEDMCGGAHIPGLHSRFTDQKDLDQRQKIAEYQKQANLSTKFLKVQSFGELVDLAASSKDPDPSEAERAVLIALRNSVAVTGEILQSLLLPDKRPKL